MECDQLEIHNQVKQEKQVFNNIFEYQNLKDTVKTEDHQISKYKEINEETEDNELKNAGKIEGKVNIQTFSSTISEEDTLNLHKNSDDEEEERIDWEESIKTFFSTSTKEEILDLIGLNSRNEEEERIDWEEIIKTFFSTSTKEEMLNLIGLDDSYIRPGTSETSYGDLQPHFCISDIKKLIKSKKQRVKQKIVRTRKKPASLTFICDQCNKEFSSLWLRRKHWINTKHKEFEICTVCNKPYIFLQKHIYIKHSETLFMCSKCGKVFTSQTDVDSHSSVHSFNQNLYCFVCNKSIDDSKALQKHVKAHFNLLLLMCDICEMEFVDSAMLEEHSRLYHYTCPVCGIMYNMQCHLNEHYRQVHKNIGLFWCESCNKSYKTKAKLKEHIKRIHLKEFPFICLKCDEKFISEPKLKYHITVTHEPKKFKCDICAKKFSFQGSLISHMEIHSGNKKIEFKCGFCNAVYEKKIMLTWHLRGSRDEGFSCKECVVNFSCRTKYNEHVAEHEEKNIKFTCDYCPYSHKSESVVKRHMSTLHTSEYLGTNKDTVKCQLCGHLCSTQHELCRHQRRSHRMFRGKRRK